MPKRKCTKILLSALTALSLSFPFTGCALFNDTAAQAPVGIVSVEKTSSEGLVDTYTIYYSDGTTSTFEITNGADGKDGKDGKDGTGGDGVSVGILSIEKTAENGLVDTYTIYYSNGTTSTFEITNGADGEDGENGRDITALELYETYTEIYGDELTYAEFLTKYMSFGETEETDGYTVINECLQSVGKVYCEFTENGAAAMYTGACVLYKMDEDYTYFITNYHVVYDKDADTDAPSISENIHCYLYGSESAPKKTNSVYTYDDYAIACEYIGGTVQYDVAVIRAETAAVLRINENVREITFADEYHVGQAAIAIGNPNGNGISVTQGIVSVDNEYISLNIDGTSRSYRSIRMDTALYGGNSGGGLFNENGELIGIANAGKVEDQNINYAVPVQTVKGVTENIMTYYGDGNESTNGAYKITLGITVTSQNSKYVYDAEKGYGNIVEEVLVQSVESGSIAAKKLGIKTGDILAAIVIDGVQYDLHRYFEIGNYLFSVKAGTSIAFVKDSGERTNAYTVQAADLTIIE